MKSSESPYSRFANDDLTLRDYLAVDRTIAANERTLLGYIRTAMALLVTGASLVTFFDAEALHVAGWALGLASLPLAGFGGWKFVRRWVGLKPLLPRLDPK